jgi:uncharacterized protein
MQGETDLNKLLKTLKPVQHTGDYVFCVVNDVTGIEPGKIISLFREAEGTTIIIPKELADELKLEYHFIASWITLSVHSSLAAVGLTAAFSKALTDAGISCNVVAAFYHDHIFVDKKDAAATMELLEALSQQ